MLIVYPLSLSLHKHCNKPSHKRVNYLNTFCFNSFFFIFVGLTWLRIECTLFISMTQQQQHANASATTVAVADVSPQRRVKYALAPRDMFHTIGVARVLAL